MLKKLSNVTVVAIDSAAPALLKLAIEDTLKEIEPAEVIIWSDTDPGIPGVRHLVIPPITSFIGYANYLWYSVPQFVTTSHFLVIQWDGWVLDRSHWSDDFLRFDYIGAIWPWFDTARVGNGGFSLRSKRLAQRIAEDPKKFPTQEKEDEALCRHYRYSLDRDGEFIWAPEALANKFAFECAAPPPSGTFGFHDCRNFPNVLGIERLEQRLSVANDYISQKPQFQQLGMMSCI